ncbi:MAG: signal peptidase I [Ruminococcus sp.]|nr:signal peptidase I [Ruminococcus sp.]
MTEVPDSSKRSPRSGLADLAETIVITLFIVTLIFTYLFRIATINGGSMENTLMPNDKVIVNLINKKPDNGDIVLIDAGASYTLSEDGTVVKGDGVDDIIVKRVIARGGQTIDIDFVSGKVYVDGEMLRENYVRLGLTHTDEGAFTGQYPLTVPDGYLFVMGDHRSVSKDSRSDEIGFIPEKCVIGKVVLRFYPFSSLGTVS